MVPSPRQQEGSRSCHDRTARNCPSGTWPISALFAAADRRLRLDRPSRLGAAPFTLQTFGVFAAPWPCWGAAGGSLAVGLYLLLGLVGLPVFAGFAGGPGALLGTSGG